MERIRHIEFFANDDDHPTGPPIGPRTSPVVALLVLGLGLTTLMGATGHMDTFAQQMVMQFNRWSLPALPEADAVPEDEEAPAETMREHPAHPNAMHADYLSRSVFGKARPDSSLLRQFHALLDRYDKRQRIDGNFDLRVTNSKTHELLEVYTLHGLKAQYEQGTSMDWGWVDSRRRIATRRVVDKWEDRGIPREDIRVRWGRAHQVREAHERDQPYLEYEMRLMEFLDLSLLPTEIGTVETFNQDWMVSHVGARSRYQMMPWILRRSGVNTYKMRTEAGNWIRVREEEHPLLTMEPAFLLLRGYVNAVGHEIPGISAYHTGPGNIYNLLRMYLRKSKHYYTHSTVMDGFMWGLTEGFDQVNEVSTFGHYSRGYVPSTYGALMANDDQPIDTTATLRTARVQLRPGARITLQELLDVLADGSSLDWGPGDADRSLYQRFVDLNPHIDLPDARDGELPNEANVRFVASVDGDAVRFFLPLGAPKRLRDAGHDVLNPDATFRFDGKTYADGKTKTEWDRTYAALIDDTKRFGFTPKNRELLLSLHDKFQELAEENPTHYRQSQLRVIQTHKRIWLSDVWEKLSKVAMDATGRARMRIQPPVEIQVPGLPTASNSSTTKIADANR